VGDDILDDMVYRSYHKRLSCCVQELRRGCKCDKSRSRPYVYVFEMELQSAKVENDNTYCRLILLRCMYSSTELGLDFSHIFFLNDLAIDMNWYTGSSAFWSEGEGLRLEGNLFLLPGGRPLFPTKAKVNIFQKCKMTHLF
jgi:hypothetical protein